MGMSVGWACGRARGRGALREGPSGVGWNARRGERNGRMGDWRGSGMGGLWDLLVLVACAGLCRARLGLRLSGGCDTAGRQLGVLGPTGCCSAPRAPLICMMPGYTPHSPLDRLAALPATPFKATPLCFSRVADRLYRSPLISASPGEPDTWRRGARPAPTPAPPRHALQGHHHRRCHPRGVRGHCPVACWPAPRLLFQLDLR